MSEICSPAFIIKVCGITTVDDGQAAVDAGANALGFNFYPKSARYIQPLAAAPLAQGIRGEYLRVGVFVNASLEDLEEAGSTAELDVLQLHGTVPASLPGAYRIWRAVAADALPVPDAAFEAYLLDSPCSTFGGSGETFDWSWAVGFPGRFILAGGLHPDNVADAIAATHPWGVDACSRLEAQPGRKHPGRSRAFVAAARSAYQDLEAEEMIVTV